MLLCQPYINYSELFITLITYFSLPPKLMIDSDKQDRCKIPCRFKPVVLNFIQIWSIMYHALKFYRFHWI